jgi:hypothetical protein
MIIDNNLVLSNAQQVLSSGASTDYINALAAGDAVAPGARLHVLVNTLFVTANSATLQVSLQSADNADFTDAVTHAQTSAIAVASLTAQAVLFDIQIPPSLVDQYIRVYYTVGTGVFTAGNVDARIVIDTGKTVDKQL